MKYKMMNLKLECTLHLKLKPNSNDLISIDRMKILNMTKKVQGKIDLMLSRILETNLKIKKNTSI